MHRCQVDAIDEGPPGLSKHLCFCAHGSSLADAQLEEAAGKSGLETGTVWGHEPALANRTRECRTSHICGEQ